MARLFITPREIDFISDLTKEINKDVIGQKVFYYKIRADLTDIHEVYEEYLDEYEFIMRLDADDFLYPRSVKTLFDSINKSDDYGAAYG